MIFLNYELEVVDVTDLQPAKVYHLYLSRYHYMKQHYHHNVELVYVIKGSFIAYVNAKRTRVDSDTLFLVNANEIHYFEMLEDSEMITILLSYDMLKKYDENIVNILFDLTLNVSKHQALKDMIVTMDRYRKGHDPYKQIKVQEYLCAISYSLFHYFQKERTQKEIYSLKQLSQIQEILDYIENHYDHTITINELCEKFHYSSAYLCRYFKKMCGISILQYIKLIRLKHAYIDVCQSDKEISQIAYENGFVDTKAFIKAFKETYDVTPGIYRKVNNCQ